MTLSRSGRYEPRKWIIPMTCRNSGTVGAGMSRMAATFSESATIPSAVNLWPKNLSSVYLKKHCLCSV